MVRLGLVSLPQMLIRSGGESHSLDVYSFQIRSTSVSSAQHRGLVVGTRITPRRCSSGLSTHSLYTRLISLQGESWFSESFLPALPPNLPSHFRTEKVSHNGLTTKHANVERLWIFCFLLRCYSSVQPSRVVGLRDPLIDWNVTSVDERKRGDPEIRHQRQPAHHPIDPPGTCVA